MTQPSEHTALPEPVRPRRGPRPTRLVRASVRGAAAGLLLALCAAPVAALADEPVGWESAPHVSTLDFFLVLLIAPAALAALIWLLVMVPSWLRGNSYETGQAWAGDDEWFGGPKDGLGHREPAQVEAGADQGGAGARY